VPLRRPRSDSASAVAGAASAAAAAVAPPEAVALDLEAAAFFDVDNTMMMGASIFHFARGLAARGYFTSRDLVHFAWQQVTFRVAGQENLEGIAAARESALAFVAGRNVNEIISFGEEIYDELMAERIWAGTRALAQQHLDAGQRVWLVTATPVELASVIARRLGLTGALGTVAAVEDGQYTGQLVGEPLHGPAKAEAVLALAQREGLDLKRCAAYSDSSNDLPMLELVGSPHAVNPDPDLRKVARERQWDVHDFRTARRVARVGVPAAAGAGAVAGGVVAAAAVRRSHRTRALPPAWLRDALVTARSSAHGIESYEQALIRELRRLHLPDHLPARPARTPHWPVVHAPPLPLTSMRWLLPR